MLGSFLIARKKKLNKVLSENAVQIISKEIRDVITESFPNFPEQYLCLVEQTVRPPSLQRQFIEARKSMGLNIKEAAAKLKMPQYRLKAAEGGISREIKPDIFWKYCNFLGLDEFVQQWIAANEELAIEIDLTPAREET